MDVFKQKELVRSERDRDTKERDRMSGLSKHIDLAILSFALRSCQIAASF